jgi:protein-S-isoprenylcysteine O-methyltransferase Ste14
MTTASPPAGVGQLGDQGCRLRPPGPCRLTGFSDIEELGHDLPVPAHQRPGLPLPGQRRAGILPVLGRHPPVEREPQPPARPPAYRAPTEVPGPLLKPSVRTHSAGLLSSLLVPAAAVVAKVFVAQGLFQLLVSAPVQLAAASPLPRTARRWLFPAGIGVMVAGAVIEALADQQKTQFQQRDDDKPEVLDTGLWGWSRHPNYFGDSLGWDGAWLTAAASSPAAWTVPAPVAVSYLLILAPARNAPRHLCRNNRATVTISNESRCSFPARPRRPRRRRSRGRDGSAPLS